MTAEEKQKVEQRIAEVKEKHLTTLDLSDNNLNQFPPQVTKLRSLTLLDLSSNNLTQLLPEIIELQGLATLDLSYNNLIQIPSEVTKLRGLTALYLSSNNLTQLPSEIIKLQNLTELDLSYNNLTQFPPEIIKLRNLITLDLSSNNLTQLPPEIIKLRNLITLDLISNNLTELPPEITKLQSLTTLDLSYNNLTEFPPEITKLQNLTTLDLGNNNLTQFPPEITKLQNLTSLYLRSTNLTQLPPEIIKLQSLITLDLSYNNLTQLPPEIIKLRNLTTLYLRSNNLTELLPEIIKLKNLITLDLSYNNLTELPPEITKLKNLITLDLRNTNLTELPPEIIELRQLKTLRLPDNQITIPPPEIVNQGIFAIFNYFEELKEVDYIYEAKLLIVGEERAGKTSLMKSLTDPSFNLNKDELSTEGIDIQTWHIPKGQTGLSKDFRLNVWDFGGQEIYHATHQFFLSKRSVYLLVTEPRKEVRHDDFYYWLNIIELLGEDSPVLLVQNKCDQPLEDIPVREYKTRFSNITDNLIRTSCKFERKETIGNLQTVIAKIVQNKDLLPHIGDKLPKVWVDVRKELSALQKQNIPQITYKDYLDICQKFDMNEERAGFLADFFHDLGIFLHFKKDDLLKRTVFLNNEWVTKGVYKVLDDPMVIENFGEFSQEELNQLWKDTVYEGWEAEFIALMQVFKICYQIRGKDKSYLAPHRLPKDKPEKLIWEDTNNLHFEYRYDFMPKGMLARFIVESYRYICENYQWRYGVLLERKNTFALVREDYFNRRITIRLRGENKKDLLADVRETFEDIHKSFNKLVVEELLSCVCPKCKSSSEPYFFSHKTLESHLSKGITQVICEKHSEYVNIKSILEGTDPELENSPIQLTGKQCKRLTEALNKSFIDEMQLDRMLVFNFEKQLNEIVKLSNMTNMIFQLIRRAEAEGWLKELILAAIKENPDSPFLLEVIQELNI